MGDYSRQAAGFFQFLKAPPQLREYFCLLTGGKGNLQWLRHLLYGEWLYGLLRLSIWAFPVQRALENLIFRLDC